jgi:hypothetical protein
MVFIRIELAKGAGDLHVVPIPIYLTLNKSQKFDVWKTKNCFAFYLDPPRGNIINSF